jgi:hypothetical protein
MQQRHFLNILSERRASQVLSLHRSVQPYEPGPFTDFFAKITD